MRISIIVYRGSENDVMDAQSEVSMLARLGLTSAQAKVLFALFQSDLPTARAISKISGIARSDVYRVMVSLENLGLVEKTVSAPCKYGAVSVEDAILILMKHRMEETAKLQVIASLVIKKLKKSEIENTFKDAEPQFVLVPHKTAIINRIRNTINRVQKSVDLLVSWQRLSEGVTDFFAKNIEGAFARSVKFRILVENPPKDKSEEHVIQRIRKNPFSQLRFIPQNPSTVMGIYDEKEISLVINPATSLPDSPQLWSNCPSLVNMAKDYFEVLWMNATENQISSSIE